jgi:hypothetical protein
MLRMFGGAATDLFHCVAAFLSVDREKTLGPPLIILDQSLTWCTRAKKGVFFPANSACFQRRICFVEAV